jgi:ABC-type lipoprotein export system ATPase subunit
MSEPVVDTVELGRRYGRTWALHECTLRLPARKVVGLVGPNGGGKTTLLHLLVGLLRPTQGSVSVLGGRPGSPAVRLRVGFVAQDKPLYRGFSVTETPHMGGWLNPDFDRQAAVRRLSRLEIPMGQRVGRLSGGQQAQVALALALGKRPDLLILDEPVSSLDPHRPAPPPAPGLPTVTRRTSGARRGNAAAHQNQRRHEGSWNPWQPELRGRGPARRRDGRLSSIGPRQARLRRGRFRGHG